MADKKYGGLTAFVNKHIMPVAAKIGNFKPLIAVRDGIAMAMPLIIVGSLFMIINSFPAPGWSDWLAKTAVHGVSIAQILAKITNGSFGIMGLIAASVFFILTPSIMSGDKVPVEGFPYTYLGSRGLFVAIIFGLSPRRSHYYSTIHRQLRLHGWWCHHRFGTLHRLVGMA